MDLSATRGGGEEAAMGGRGGRLRTERPNGWCGGCGWGGRWLGCAARCCRARDNDSTSSSPYPAGGHRLDRVSGTNGGFCAGEFWKPGRRLRWGVTT